MSWKLTLRGDSTAPIAAEYECPVHGPFTVTVPRPAPDEMSCPAEDPDDDFNYCGRASLWRFPTPVGRVKMGEVAKGKVMDYPPEDVCLDTRPLADGMPYSEWKSKQMAITRDLGLRRARAGQRR